MFLTLFFQILSCDTLSTKKIENKTDNIFGLYSYMVTGYNSNCESVKHSIRLNPDSSFIFKIYCFADSTSPFMPTMQFGRWTKLTDSIFHFICTDTTTFDIALLPTKELKIVRPKIDDNINFEFTIDTTKDEMDWQISKWKSKHKL